MTDNGAEGEFVTDQLFARVAAQFSTEQIVCLTTLIAWENASARFNRALDVASQELWNDTNRSS